MQYLGVLFVSHGFRKSQLASVNGFTDKLRTQNQRAKVWRPPCTYMLPCRDEESPYLSAKAPPSGGPPTLGQRVYKELKQNWWLWGSVIFAILLVGGLVLFRNQLYDTASHGLPFLAGE